MAFLQIKINVINTPDQFKLLHLMKVCIEFTMHVKFEKAMTNITMVTMTLSYLIHNSSLQGSQDP